MSLKRLLNLGTLSPIYKKGAGAAEVKLPPPLPTRSGLLPAASTVARVLPSETERHRPEVQGACRSFTSRPFPLSGLSIHQKFPGCIGHLGSSPIGHVSNLLLGHVSSFLLGHISGLPPGHTSSLLLGQVTNLRRSARAIASARLETPSLDRMWLTWARAVERLTVNRWAMSGLLNPSTIRARTSRSRVVRS